MEIIKDGKKYVFEFAHYGEERELNMNENEIKIAEYLKTIFPAEIVRKSDDYLTAVYKGHDIVRFKFTDRAKWVNLPYLDLGKVKRRFDKIDDLSQFKDDIIKSCEMAIKFD